MNAQTILSRFLRGGVWKGHTLNGTHHLFHRTHSAEQRACLLTPRILIESLERPTVVVGINSYRKCRPKGMANMKRAALTAISVALLCNGLAAEDKAATRPSPRQVLSTLRDSHPRLILTDARLAEIKQAAKTDKLLARYIQDVIGRADRLSTEPPLVYKKKGPRLLRVSRACVDRAYTLGLAWRLTGTDTYAKKLVENLQAVCGFKDWNPSHFLDTAEMAHGVGIGYDWLHDYLTPEVRASIRAGLLRNGIEPGLAAYREGHTWVTKPWNWNQVCNGGLLIGALAIAESHPAEAGEIVSSAVASLPASLASYEPDGAWGEGPGYWGYATSYTAHALAALDTALGTDFRLSRREGLRNAGFFVPYITGPTGRLFNFADAYGRVKPTAFHYWLARRYGLPELVSIQNGMLKEDQARAMDVIWYWRPDKPKAFDPSLDKLFRGRVAVAVFRSAWKDPEALFVAVKAGDNTVGHAQLDLGSFVLEAMGVRWAVDLGADNYNLTGYWDKYSNDGQRWSYYRTNSLSHNVPLLDNTNQDWQAETRIVRFKGAVERPFAELDLTSAYTPAARSVRRGVAMTAGRRAVLVQDEFDLAGTCEVAWGMTTKADISLNASSATLTAGGKTLEAKILAPQGAAFTVESAEQAPPQRRNKGVRRLMVRLPEQSGKVTVSILLSPVWPDGKAAAPEPVVPLSDW